jgi:dolichol-phosphate mannosyltransferase
MDADFFHDPADIPKLIQAADRYDLSIGSRYKGGIRVINWPLRRLFLSLFANYYVRFFTGLPVYDCTSGFRCYSRKIAENIILKRNFATDGYAFLVETLYHIFKNSFSISEVSIVFSERRQGQSKMSRKVILEAALLPIKLLF